METIRIGGVPEHFNMPWHLAIDGGKFKHQSIDLQWVDFHGGTGAMCHALRCQEIDLAVILTEGIINDIAKGNPSKILQYYVSSPLQWGIHVYAHSEYQKPEDLEGKIYAISRLGSGSHLMAYVDAHQRGWNVERLKFKVVHNLNGAREALKMRQADLFFWEKYTTQPYVDQKEFRRIGVCPTPWACFVLVARKAVLQEKPKVVKSIQKIINQSCQEVPKTPKYGELISQKYGLEIAQVREWLSQTRWATEEKMDLQNLEKTANYLKMLKIISPDFEVQMLVGK